MNNNPLVIYQVPKGEIVQLHSPEGTAALNERGQVTEPVPWGSKTWSLGQITIVGSSFEKEVEIAREALNKLPDLGHKFVLTWTPETPFYRCCLVSTSGDWWEKYPPCGVIN